MMRCRGPCQQNNVAMGLFQDATRSGVTMDGRLIACRCCGYNSVETNLLNNSTIRIYIYMHLFNLCL